MSLLSRHTDPEVLNHFLLAVAPKLTTYFFLFVYVCLFLVMNCACRPPWEPYAMVGWTRECLNYWRGRLLEREDRRLPPSALAREPQAIRRQRTPPEPGAGASALARPSDDQHCS